MHRQTASLATLAVLCAGIPSASRAVTEIQQLPVNAPAASAGFGSAVAISNNLAVVAASGRSPGEADIYGFDGANWSFVATITGDDTLVGDDFGASVAIFFGNPSRIVVGAPGATISTVAMGAAYVFRDDAVQGWIQEAKLVAVDGAAGDQFAVSVALSDSVALIGADQADNTPVSTLLTDSGSTYVFRRNGTSWLQDQELVAPTAADFDFFGASVALSGSAALVGADGSNADAGAAYVFRDGAGTWTHEKTLLAPSPVAGDGFGFAVALSGSTALVGAEGRSGSGAAYVFRDEGPDWVQKAELVASDAALLDRFGHSVGITSTSAVVGALGADNQPAHSGKAYSFGFNGSSWSQVSQLTASNGAVGDLFGNSVALSGTQILVGAVRHDGNSLTDSGAAYAFVPEPGALALHAAALAALACLGRARRRQ